jgi:hypothetical protein
MATPPAPRSTDVNKWIATLSSAFDKKYNPAPTPTKVAYTLTKQVTLALRGGISTTFPKGAHMVFDHASIVTVVDGQTSSYLDLDEIVGIDLPRPLDPLA